MNFKTVVHTWTAPTFRRPERLTAAGNHSPARVMTMDQNVLPPLLRNRST